MRCFVVLLCVAYAFAVDPASARNEHKAHHKRPDADYKDLDDEKIRIYVHPIKNSGSSESVYCSLRPGSLNMYTKYEDTTNHHAAIPLNHLQVTTPEICAATCSGRPECRGFDFVVANQANGATANECFLKGAGATPANSQPAPGVDFYVRKDIPLITFEHIYQNGFGAGEVYDYAGGAALKAADLESGSYDFQCESGDDAVFIRKIQYKRDVNNTFQANVMTVFDTDATCNTANMRMNVIGKNCPSGGKIYCVGKDFEYDSGLDKCVVCKNQTDAPDGHSPCGVYYAEDLGDLNDLGYHKPTNCESKPGFHTCARAAVSGHAKCCHRVVPVTFKKAILNDDGSYNWGKK